MIFRLITHLVLVATISGPSTMGPTSLYTVLPSGLVDTVQPLEVLSLTAANSTGARTLPDFRSSRNHLKATTA